MARGKTTDDPTTLQMALIGYELEKKRIEDRIREIKSQLGRRGATIAVSSEESAAPRKRNLSPEARRRIAMAQKRRWAEHRRKAAAAAKSSKPEQS